MRKIDRLNETNVNIFGTTMKIIENNNYNDIWIEFQDEYRQNYTKLCIDGK